MPVAATPSPGRRRPLSRLVLLSLLLANTQAAMGGVGQITFPVQGSSFVSFQWGGFAGDFQIPQDQVALNQAQFNLKAGMVNNATYPATWPISGWNTGEWHHVASSWDGTNWNLFFDGVLKAQLPTGNGPLKMGLPLTMGGESISGVLAGLLGATFD